MQTIPLTQGKIAIVDDEDFEWAMKWKWTVLNGRSKHGNRWYARRTGAKNHCIYLHREIAIRAGLPNSRYYDHKDRDGLNNQRNNIRPCTQTQNNANGQKTPGCSSQFKGVAWHSLSGKWRAEIQVSRKRFYLGLFTTEEAAAAAYQAAALKHFGEFAA